MTFKTGCQLIKIQVEGGTKERIMVRGQAVEARRFSMTGTKGRSGSVWYDDAGSLVKAIVTTVARPWTMNSEPRAAT